MLENLIDAVAHGAVIRNYCEVTGADMNGGQMKSLRVRDGASGREEGELRAKVFVNATGAWFDRIQSLLSGRPSRRIRTTKESRPNMRSHGEEGQPALLAGRWTPLLRDSASGKDVDRND